MGSASSLRILAMTQASRKNFPSHKCLMILSFCKNKFKMKLSKIQNQVFDINYLIACQEVLNSHHMIIIFQALSAKCSTTLFPQTTINLTLINSLSQSQLFY